MYDDGHLKQHVVQIEEMKMWIIMVTGWNESVLSHMTDEQIKKIYRERVEKRGEVSKG